MYKSFESQEDIGMVQGILMRVCKVDFEREVHHLFARGVVADLGSAV